MPRIRRRRLPPDSPSRAPLRAPTPPSPLLPLTNPSRDQLADWRHLQATAGATWLLAAPLVCPDATMGGGGRLLGAVLVAGRGKQPTTDERWLEDW